MFGEYGGFIVPAYAISAAVIVALVIWPSIAYRRRLREIEALERQGIHRRSGKRGDDGN